jgi:hypothetical protein
MRREGKKDKKIRELERRVKELEAEKEALVHAMTRTGKRPVGHTVDVPLHLTGREVYVQVVNEEVHFYDKHTKTLVGKSKLR